MEFVIGRLIKKLFRIVFKTKNPIENWGDGIVGILSVLLLVGLLYIIFSFV